MSIQIEMGDNEEIQDAIEISDTPSIDPDEYFAKSAFRIVYQTNNFLLPQLRDLIDKGEILNLRPEYQRRLRWNVQQKSRLIESLLLNIPVPPIFLYESAAARYEVMDGQQRLNAVREFLAGGFALSGLTVLKPLNNIRYSKCPPRIKRALDRASVSAVVLLLESEPENSTGHFTIADIRRFIFDRLNTGGTKLNAQEIRNALYLGKFNETLIELTRFPLFTEVFDIPPYVETDPADYYENPKRQENVLYATMADCQLVLRYFALKDDTNIRGAMRAMLDRAMASRMNISKEDADLLADEYKERFTFLYEVFDQKPFVLAPDDKTRVKVSAAIYDSAMVALNNLWLQRGVIMKDKANVAKRMQMAINDEKHKVVLTGKGNTAEAVRERIKLMTNIFIPGSVE